MSLSRIKDFRKLEERLGKETSDVLFRILQQQEKMTLDQLASKGDVTELKTEVQKVRSELKTEIQELRTEFKLEILQLEVRVYQAIGGVAWRTAGLLVAQTAVIMGLLKIAGVY